MSTVEDPMTRIRTLYETETGKKWMDLLPAHAGAWTAALGTLLDMQAFHGTDLDVPFEFLEKWVEDPRGLTREEIRDEDLSKLKAEVAALKRAVAGLAAQSSPRAPGGT